MCPLSSVVVVIVWQSIIVHHDVVIKNNRIESSLISIIRFVSKCVVVNKYCVLYHGQHWDRSKCPD